MKTTGIILITVNITTDLLMMITQHSLIPLHSLIGWVAALCFFICYKNEEEGNNK